MTQTVQTNMPTHNGLAPGLNQYGHIKNMQWVPQVTTKTAAYTVTYAESGSIFITEGATAAVAFTLPAASEGPWIFEFYNAEDIDMSVVAGTADTMVALNDVAADSVAFSTTSLKVGGSCRVFSAGSTNVYVQILSDGNTVTVGT